MKKNPQVAAEWLQQEFFNQMLVALTDLNKSIKAQELSQLLVHAKKMASTCAKVAFDDSENKQFWKDVYENLKP